MSTTVDEQTEPVVSDLEQAVADLAAMRDRAARAEATRDAHALEAREIESSAGASLLDSEDPEEGERVATRLGQLRASVELQGRAALEAHERARHIEARALRVQAALMEPAVQQARAELEKFDAKTDRLIKQLVDHTRYVVRLVDPGVDAQERALTQGSASFETPPRWNLSRDLASAERRHRLALALADVVEGSCPISEVRAAFSGSSSLSTSVDPAVWEDLPQLVRDEVILIDGLWLRASWEERDWQREYDQLHAELEAAERRQGDIEARRSSTDAAVRSAALKENLEQVRFTVETLRARKHALPARAMAVDDVQVVTR